MSGTQSREALSEMSFRAPEDKHHHLELRSMVPVFDVFTPGRVNLIGEHMDYNGGLSLPFAIQAGIHFSLRTTDGQTGRLPSTLIVREEGGPILGVASAPAAHQEASSRQDETAIEASQRGTLSFLQGTWTLAKEAFGQKAVGKESRPSGGVEAELVLTSTLPQGAGLSSSAALSIGLLAAFARLLGAPRESLLGTHNAPCAERARLARLAQRIEHEYAGTPCGLMDQLAIIETQPETLLTLDFSKPSPEYAKGIPGYPEHRSASLGRLRETHKLLVLHSGRKHTLSDGNYESRKRDCGEALGRLLSGPLVARSSQVSTLGQLFALNPQIDASWLGDHLASGPSLLRRATYVLEERLRSLRCVHALETGDLAELDTLLDQGQDGLRELYEVSCTEIDWLVAGIRHVKSELARQSGQDHSLIGGRMMGGGWGGSLILFGAKSQIHKIEDRLGELVTSYKSETGYHARLIETDAGPGLASLLLSSRWD